MNGTSVPGVATPESGLTEIGWCGTPAANWTRLYTEVDDDAAVWLLFECAEFVCERRVGGGAGRMSESDLIAFLINEKKAGQRVPLTVLRGGEKVKLMLPMQ